MFISMNMLQLKCATAAFSTRRFAILRIAIFSLVGLGIYCDSFMVPSPRFSSLYAGNLREYSQRQVRRLCMSVKSNKVSSRSKKNEIVYAQNVLDARWSYGDSQSALNGSKNMKANKKENLMARFDVDAWFMERADMMDTILDSVVRVYCTHNLPSFSMPWQRMRQDQSTSSGFVIEGRRIITNAHSVEYSTMIQVRKRGSDRKYLAKAMAIGEECDLAILTVDDDHFWEDSEPLKMGHLAKLTDDVSVVGYPVGGECISITAGVVSRVEMTVYAQTNTELTGTIQADMELLSIQIDAAINPGNSGGPVINDAGEIVGVAFQSLEGEDVENIGYVVPVNVLQHFLEDVRRHNGVYTGFPRLGVGLQFLESPTLRSMLLMDDSVGMTGVMISDVEATTPAAQILKPRDVIVSVDGIKVANDGSVPFREGERVALRYYFSQLFKGDEVSVTILREGNLSTVTVPLSNIEHLCPFHFQGAPPNYAVFGGLVFTTLSDPYLREALEGQRKPLSYLVTLSQFGRRASSDENIVVLTQVLAHPTSLGYESHENLHLQKFNNEPVRSLKHLCDMIDATGNEGYLHFEFYPNKMVVLDAASLVRSTEEVCEDNAIPFPRSKNLMSLNKSLI